MDFDPNPNVDRDFLDSAAAISLAHELAARGADFWTANVIWRTGYNATHVQAHAMRDYAGPVGVIHATGYYARFREHGTRHNEAEHVLADYLDLVGRA